MISNLSYVISIRVCLKKIVFLSRKVLKFQKQKIGQVKKYKGQMKKKTKIKQQSTKHYTEN